MIKTVYHWTVSWSNNSHVTVLVEPVYGYLTFPLTFGGLWEGLVPVNLVAFFFLSRCFLNFSVGVGAFVKEIKYYESLMILTFLYLVRYSSYNFFIIIILMTLRIALVKTNSAIALRSEDTRKARAKQRRTILSHYLFFILQYYKTNFFACSGIRSIL